MTYEVRLEQFEGPLELLLELIEREKLDITRVSLSRVADQYLDYLERADAPALAHLSAFLSIATRLLLLKSRALLPLLEFTEEEEQAIDDLEHQLKRYQRFRELARMLDELWRKKHPSLTREPSVLLRRPVFAPPRDLTVEDLACTFREVLGGIPLVERLDEETLATVVTLEEKMIEFKRSLETRASTSFRTLAVSAENRLELIVSFLALLELVKQRLISVRQPEFFGDIHVEHCSLKRHE